MAASVIEFKETILDGRRILNFNYSSIESVPEFRYLKLSFYLERSLNGSLYDFYTMLNKDKG